MSGLLIKDWKLLKRQGRYYGMVLILVCAMIFVGSKSYSSFITSYLTFMISMFAISSFSYDELDNGMAFLMALPSGRKHYVQAKYLFSFLLITGGWLAGVVIRLVLFLMRFSLEEYLEILPEEPVYLMVCLTYVGCIIPVLLKYGAEKGRNIAFMALAVIAIGVFLTAKTGLYFVWGMFFRWLSQMPPAMLFILSGGICALVLAASYRISVRIIRKKEF